MAYNSDYHVMQFCNGSLWVAAGGAGGSLSSLTSGNIANTIDSTLYTQTWNWSTLATATSGLSLNATNASGGANAALSVTNNTTGAGFGVASTLSDSGNTGYALYGSNASASGYGVYSNGAAKVAGALAVTGTSTLAALTATGTATLSALSSAGVVLNSAAGVLSTSGGALAVANGGTGLASGTQYGLPYFATTTSMGSTAAGTTTTLLHGNASGSPVWSAVGLTTDVTGTLPVGNGGTGIASYTVGDIPYASGATTLAKLADAATGNALISGGVGVAPSWGKIDLTAAVTGSLPVANGGTGATAFTQGSVVFAGASGVYSQNNANFFWDNTNHYLGIGTTSPGYKLEVAGTASFATQNFTIDANGSLTTQGSTLTTNVPNGAVGVNIGPQAGTGLYVTNKAGNTAYNALLVKGIASQTSVAAVQDSSGNPLLTVLGSGYVGIGTASPATKLHIYGGASGGTAYLPNSTSYLTLETGGRSVMQFLAPSSTDMEGFLFGNETTNLAAQFYYNPSAGSFTWYRSTNGNEMTLDGTGKLGIGTTSPGRTVDIVASAADTVAGNDALRVQSTGTSGYGASLVVNSTTITGGRGYGIISSGTSDTGGAGNLLFVDNSAAGAPRMAINSSGYVGIGTTSPGATEHIVGPANTDNLIVASNTASTATGISLNVPTGAMAWINADNGTTLAGLSNSLGIYTGGGDIIFAPNNSETVRMAPGGNVGIGTASPATKLHIYGGASGGTAYLPNSTSYLTLETGGRSVMQFLAPSSTDMEGFLFGNETTNLAAQFYYNPSAGSFTWYRSTNGNEMTLDGTGKLGIGTTSPQNKIDVAAGNIGILGTSSIEQYGLYYREPTINAMMAGIGFNRTGIGGAPTDIVFYTNKANNLSTTPSSADEVMRITNSGEAEIYGNVYGGCLEVGGWQSYDCTATWGSGNILAAANIYCGACGNWLTAWLSDNRLKKNIRPMKGDNLALIEKLQAVTWDWRKPEERTIGKKIIFNDPDRRQMGLIAQDVEKVFPLAIRTGDNGIKQFVEGGLTAPIVEAIKELDQKFIAQADEVSALKTANDNEAGEIKLLKAANDNEAVEIKLLKANNDALKADNKEFRAEFEAFKVHPWRIVRHLPKPGKQ